MSTKLKSLVVILLYMVLIISYAAAASATESLTLTGYVPEREAVEVQPNGERERLELTDESGTALVGTIKENSTAKQRGYTVEVSSANAQRIAADHGVLTGSQSGSHREYQILYRGEVVTLHNGSARLGGYVLSGSEHAVEELAVAYSDSQFVASSDSYSDTLTLSVVSN
ncbi:MAG: hypothetical protein ACQEQU_09620 [Spirochaetota bacterium]